MKLGDFIQEYRKQHDLSQRQFAEKCNLSNGYISMLEKGMNPNTGEPVTPTLLNLKKLADGMNITIMKLLEVIDDMPLNISEQVNINQTSYIQILYDNLNTEGQEQLLNYTKYLFMQDKYKKVGSGALQADGAEDIELLLAEMDQQEKHTARVAALGGSSKDTAEVHPTPEGLEMLREIIKEDTNDNQD